MYLEAVGKILINTANIEQVNYVIWEAHNLERLGDRTVIDP